MGCYLLTETMSRRHQLSMESYDRLFPNQDTLPTGGFGNLIALPLQQVARQHGNSVFIDDAFIPYADQWSVLSGIKRIGNPLVRSLADFATRKGLVVGFQVQEPSGQGPDEEVQTESPQSAGTLRLPEIKGPVPPSVEAVLAQRLFIKKHGLPPSLLNHLKRFASFGNPEFYKRQNMRLSTALTPRIITCSEELPEHIALPRGCLSDVQALFQELNVDMVLEDKREDGMPVDLNFHGQLTPLQTDAARALLASDMGLLVAPPGMGKTVVATYLIARRQRSTLILLHRKPLLNQWISQLSYFLGIPPEDIGRIGGGKSITTGRIDVAMFQSLVRKGVVKRLPNRYGYVIVDECHHVPTVAFERVLSELGPRYLSGFTATPQRRDGLHPITRMQLGPVRFTIGAKSKEAKQPFSRTLIIRETSYAAQMDLLNLPIQTLYADLASDSGRNDLIFDDIMLALEEKRSPIILTERMDHLQQFAVRLKFFTRHLVVLHGHLKARERQERLQTLSQIPADEERVLLATGKYLGEGFDDARLDTLFLTMPVSWKGTLVQYAGRLHRMYPGKKEVRIYDYVDRNVPLLVKMFERRLRGYKAIGYSSTKR